MCGLCLHIIYTKRLMLITRLSMIITTFTVSRPQRKSDTHSSGATRPRVHLGGDYFIVLYSGNDFKCFHFLYVTDNRASTRHGESKHDSPQ